MKSVAGKIFFTALSVLYPVLVFCGLEFWGLSPRRLSILLLALAFYQFLNFTKSKSDSSALGRANFIKTIALIALILVCGVVSFCADSIMFLKFYPVLVNLSLLAFFAFTLWKKPSFAFRMANLGDKTIKRSPVGKLVERYCDKVTFAWCIFFVVNGTISFATVLCASEKVWSLYNGLISYILIGVFFGVEFIIRKVVQHNMKSYIPVSEFKVNSRPGDCVVCFEDGDSGEVTWNQFVSDVSKVRIYLDSVSTKSWILHCDDAYFYLVALMAMLQGGKKAFVTANRQEAFLKEIKKDGMGFITDAPATTELGAVLIQDLLKNDSKEIRWNTFDKSSAEMAVFTSGTTGEPKVLNKPFWLFENEAFELGKTLGDQYEGNRVYSTVNHHHVYGKAFAFFVPLVLGVPFKRTRIDYPAEIATLAGRGVVLVSSPAFLKRFIAETDSAIEFKNSPLVLSSGGPLPEDVSRKTGELLNTKVTEIYGSSETGAIAHRQIVDHSEWIPFESCKMSIAENGCLNIKSNYVLEPDGFTSGDLGEVCEDGTFKLLGRADSIVKIEEKRISLPEVEMRIRQTGLVQDVRVVPMAGKRQYLAAAIVLNAEGRKKFADARKLEINNFFKSNLMSFLENTVTPKKWRYLEELPQDTQGKIKNRDIQSLFNLGENGNFNVVKFSRDVGSFTATLVFPETSDYYNGHFPTFKLLPAVVQVDVVLRLARAFLNVPKELDRIQRTKFTNPIFPGEPATITANYNAETGKLSFSITNEASGKTLSSGIIVLKV